MTPATKLVNRPTLVTIMRIEASRAGLVLGDLGADVTLRTNDEPEGQRMTLADACGALVFLRGERCNQHVFQAAGI